MRIQCLILLGACFFSRPRPVSANPSDPSLAPANRPAKTYSSYLVGNPNDAASAEKPKGGIALMGGGDGIDDFLLWLIHHASARGAHADVLVIRATQAGEYNQKIYDLAPLNSVETIVFHSREASYDPYVLRRFRQAEVLFISGGQQNLYANLWAGTPIENEIKRMAERGVPIGGTSAGLAILGEFIYSAYNESAHSPESLRDPYHKDITLDHGFLDLPFLKQTITETHFAQRDRMGRFLVFLSRIKKDWDLPSPLFGIATDEDAAFLLETKNEAAGIATVAGIGSVYILKTPAKTPAVCSPAVPLTYAGISVQKLFQGAQFDLDKKKKVAGKTFEYELSVRDGKVSSSSESIY